MSINRLLSQYGYETNAALAREVASLLHKEPREYQRRLSNILDEGKSTIDFPSFVVLYRALSFRGCSLEKLFRAVVDSDRDLTYLLTQHVEFSNLYFDFEIIESSIDLVIKPGHTANWKKTFKVKALKPDLKRLCGIDRYHCAKDSINPVSVSPGATCTKRESFFPHHESIVDIELNCALDKEEETEFSLFYSGEGIPEDDLIFLATKTRFPTRLTTLQVTLPKEDSVYPAELCIYYGDMACEERSALSKELIEWNEAQCGFSVSLPKPLMNHWYVLYWTKSLVDV